MCLCERALVCAFVCVHIREHGVKHDAGAAVVRRERLCHAERAKRDWHAQNNIPYTYYRNHPMP